MMEASEHWMLPNACMNVVVYFIDYCFCVDICIYIYINIYLINGNK